MQAFTLNFAEFKAAVIKGLCNRIVYFATISADISAMDISLFPVEIIQFEYVCVCMCVIIFSLS